MKAAVRVDALTIDDGPKSLEAAEKHGKRQDASSQLRKVSDRKPLVYGSLNLREAFEEHVADAKTSARLKKPVLHALVQFPIALEVTPDLEQRMLDEAVNFINETHGGDAVFAARLDRDEQGKHTVDVFFSPKYLKETAETRRGNKKADLWISTTKHGKDLALKHQGEIRERLSTRKLDENGKKRDDDISSPRAVGIALQIELAEYLTRKPDPDSGFGMGDVIPRLEPRQIKVTKGPDRLDVEEFKARKDEARDAALAAAQEAEQKSVAVLAEAEAHAEKIRVKADAVTDAVTALSEEVSAMTIKRTSEGKITAADPDRLKPAFPEIRPAVAAAADLVTAMDTERSLLDARKRGIDNLEAAANERYQTNEAERRRLDALRTKLEAFGEKLVTITKAVASKLGVKPKLSEIEKALEEIQKIPEPEPSRSIVEMLKDKYSTTEEPTKETDRDGPGL